MTDFNPIDRILFYDENNKICYYDIDSKECYIENRIKNLTFGDKYYTYIENEILNIILYKEKEHYKFRNFTKFIHESQFPYQIIVNITHNMYSQNVFVIDVNKNIYSMQCSHIEDETYKCLSIHLLLDDDDVNIKNVLICEFNSYDIFKNKTMIKTVLYDNNFLSISSKNYPICNFNRVDEIISLYILNRACVLVYFYQNEYRELTIKFDNDDNICSFDDYKICDKKENSKIIVKKIDNLFYYYIFYDDKIKIIPEIDFKEIIEVKCEKVEYINKNLVRINSVLNIIDIFNCNEFIPVIFNLTANH